MKTLAIGIVALLVVIGGVIVVLPALQPLVPTVTPRPTLVATPTPAIATPPVPTPARLAFPDYGIDSLNVERNTRLYLGLVDAGLEEPLADVTAERVLVRYALPANYSSKPLAYHLFGVVLGLEPNVPLVVLQVMENAKAVEEWEASLGDVKAFADGALSEAQFEAKVKYRKL